MTDPSFAGGGETTRRLAAILYADVAGYSRLVDGDEEGAHRVFRAHFDALNETIQNFGGRIVHTAGDAVLAEFASVVTALKCAVAAQRDLAGRNEDLADDRKLRFRMGVNLGDVIIDREEIYGNGVNVAARLESLAEPGGICISGRVFEQVEKNVDVGFADLGPQTVKNVRKPVNVYRVLLDPGDAGKVVRAVGAGARRKARWGGLVGVVVLVLAAALVALLVEDPLAPFRNPAPAPDSESGPVTRAPREGKPTVAILPFEDRSEGAVKAYFADGLTEDLIVDLGRFSNLLVLSWSAVAPYRDLEIPIGELSRTLNARYVVGGTIRSSADKLRITVQLTDAERGVLLWSDRFDRKPEDVFSVQEHITQQLVGALAVRLTRIEEERAFTKPTDDLNAYDLVLRARERLHDVDRRSNVDARALFERAADIDHRYSDAIVGLGWTYMNDFRFGWSEWPHLALDKAQDHAERALGLDPGNASAHALFADILTFRRDFDRAEKEIRRAIDLNPNNPVSHAIHGSLLMWSGRPAAAVAPLELAMRLDPYPVASWVVVLAQAYYLVNRYEDTVHTLEASAGRLAEDPATYALLAAAYGQLGQKEAAARALANLDRTSPFFDGEVYARNLADPRDGKHLLEGLRKAGRD